MKLTKHHCHVLMIKDAYQMTEYIRLLIFIMIVIKNMASSIIQNGTEGVSYFYFYFMNSFYTQKKA